MIENNFIEIKNDNEGYQTYKNIMKLKLLHFFLSSEIRKLSYSIEEKREKLAWLKRQIKHFENNPTSKNFVNNNNEIKLNYQQKLGPTFAEQGANKSKIDYAYSPQSLLKYKNLKNVFHILQQELWKIKAERTKKINETKLQLRYDNCLENILQKCFHNLIVLNVKSRFFYCSNESIFYATKFEGEIFCPRCNANKNKGLIATPKGWLYSIIDLYYRTYGQRDPFQCHQKFIHCYGCHQNRSQIKNKALNSCTNINFIFFNKKFYCYDCLENDQALQLIIKTTV